MGLRIAAWNVAQPGERRGALIADAVAALDADVVFLSEWSPLRGAKLDRLLDERGWPHQTRVHTSDRSDVVQKLWGLLAVSRTPVVARPVAAPANAAASWLELRLPEHDITVVGIRVLSPTPLGYWPWLHEQANRLAGERALLIGDFNVPHAQIGTRSDPGLAALLESGWTDVDPSGRASFWSRSGRTVSRLDYCLATDGLAFEAVADVATSIDGRMIVGPDAPVRLSDHAPIVATMNRRTVGTTLGFASP